MAQPSINWNPDRKALAEFSEAGMFMLGMVLAPWEMYRGHPRWAVGFWVLAVVGRLLGLVRPSWLRPAFLGLSLVSWPIGWVVSNLALGLIYYGVFTPIALAFRLAGRDPLKRRLDPEAETYWEPANPDQGLDRYLRQF